MMGDKCVGDGHYFIMMGLYDEKQGEGDTTGINICYMIYIKVPAAQ